MNIVTLIQQYDLFQSFPPDNDRAAIIATQRIYGTLELLTADNLTESLALQWTANKQHLLKQQLKEIYAHDILPSHLQVTLDNAIKFSGDVARQSLIECASDYSEHSDDDHGSADSFTTSYNQDSNLQFHLTQSSSDDDADDQCLDLLDDDTLMEKYTLSLDSFFQEHSTYNIESLTALTPVVIKPIKLRNMLAELTTKNSSANDELFSTQPTNNHDMSVSNQSSVVTGCLLEETEIARDSSAFDDATSALFNNIRSMPSHSTDDELFLQATELHMSNSATHELERITSAYCSREQNIIDQFPHNTDAISSLQYNFLDSISSQTTTSQMSFAIVNTDGPQTSLVQSPTDCISCSSNQDAHVLIDCQLPTDLFCLFKQVHSSTSWFQLRLTVDMERYDVSYTYSEPTTANLAKMSTSDLLIHCEQLSITGEHIPYNTMTDQQLCFYCAFKYQSLFPTNLQFLHLEQYLQLARPADLPTKLPQYLRYTILHAW